MRFWVSRRPWQALNGAKVAYGLIPATQDIYAYPSIRGMQVRQSPRQIRRRACLLTNDKNNIESSRHQAPHLVVPRFALVEVHIAQA